MHDPCHFGVKSDSFERVKMTVRRSNVQRFQFLQLHRHNHTSISLYIFYPFSKNKDFKNYLILLVFIFRRNQGCNYPLKGGKDSFWEGGVRAVGFVHSKLLKQKGRVSTEMIDATDWLPTFYHLGGGDVNQIQETIDGMNVWDTISEEKPSPRTEILHNIDPIRKFAAIRVNNYKLIVNQDAVYKQTWHPRYVEDQQMKKTEIKTIPGAAVDCGQWSESKGNQCNTSEFPCLFDISNGKMHLPAFSKLRGHDRQNSRRAICNGLPSIKHDPSILSVLFRKIVFQINLYQSIRRLLEAIGLRLNVFK